MLDRLKWRVLGLFFWIFGKFLWIAGKSISLLESCVVGAGAATGVGVSVVGACVKRLGRRLSAVGERWWTGGARVSRFGPRRSRAEGRVCGGPATPSLPRQSNGGPDIAVLPRQAKVKKQRSDSKSGRNIKSRYLMRYSTVRYGTVRYGTVRYGTVRYGTVLGRFCTVQYCTVWYGTVRYWGDMVRYGTVRNRLVQFVTGTMCQKCMFIYCFDIIYFFTDSGSGGARLPRKTGDKKQRSGSKSGRKKVRICIWCCTVRYGMVRYVTVRYVTVRYGTVWHGTL